MDIVKIFSLKFTQRSYWHSHGKPAGMLGSASIFGRFYTCEPVAMLQGKLGRSRLDRPQYVQKSSTTGNSMFAVCFLSDTQQRATLSCATIKTPDLKKTHGKSILCRVLFLAHGKSILCRVPFLWHTANPYFVVCQIFFGTRQKSNFFLLLHQNFFYSLHITCVTSYLNLVYFCICLLYLTK